MISWTYWMLMVATLLIASPLLYKFYIALRIYFVIKRIEKCMSYDCKNWGTIRNLEYELNKLTQK